MLLVSVRHQFQDKTEQEHLLLSECAALKRLPIATTSLRQARFSVYAATESKYLQTGEFSAVYTEGTL